MALLRVSFSTSSHIFARDMLKLIDTGIPFLQVQMRDCCCSSKMAIPNYNNILILPSDGRLSYNYVIYLRDRDEAIMRLTVSSIPSVINLKEWRNLPD